MKKIYLDYNSTTPLLDEVKEEIFKCYDVFYGNPSSEEHVYGWMAKERLDIAAESILENLGARESKILFLSGATEANNLAITGAVRRLKELKNNPLVVSSRTEHKAVLDVVEHLGTRAEYLDVDEYGRVLLNKKNKSLLAEADFLSLMLVNNETGLITNLEEIFSYAKKAIKHCDAAQAIGKIPFQASLADLYTISSHKCYGPKGVGALIYKDKYQLKPILYGGGQQDALRPGTLNVPGICGFAKAVEICTTNLQAEIDRTKDLRNFFLNLLQSFCDVGLNTNLSESASCSLNIYLPSISSAKLMAKIGHKLAISTSSACVVGGDSHVLTSMGLSKDRISSSFRVCLGRLTTKEELEEAAKVIAKALT